MVGAGFCGIGMAIQLKRHGYQDFVVLERAEGVGGVWRENTYPGCACDIESHLYSFSFAPNAHWTSLFPGQEEIWKYLRDCVDRFQIGSHIRFGHELIEARWEKNSNRWRIETPHGIFHARILITATGALNLPSVPDLPGLSRFQGKRFHSAEWDHTVDLIGKRVAVIGTGASAIQFVPEVQKRAAKTVLFQRTPAWVLPRNDHPLTNRQKKWFRRFPILQKIERLRLYLYHEAFGVAFRKSKYMEKAKSVALRHMKQAVKDPGLRAKLTPNYMMGCKRILISDDYYPALAQSNVEVVTERISEIRERSVVTSDGTEREVDVLIFGTGFRVSDFVFAKCVYGSRGHSLLDGWNGSATAYRGTMSAGFPNWFCLLGPNTGLGHNSILLMVEPQMKLILKALRYMRRKQVAFLDVKPEAEKRYVEFVDERSRQTVWLSGCKSWYLDKTGRNSTLWPMSVGQFRRKTVSFRPSDFQRVRSER